MSKFQDFYGFWEFHACPDFFPINFLKILKLRKFPTSSNTAPPGGPDYLNRTVMSYHYYCWALGYVSDDETDPVLTTVCDEVSIFLVITDHCLMLVAGTGGVQHSECQGWRAGGQCHNVD